MSTDPLISLTDFCSYHQLDVAFVQIVEEQGLIQTIRVEHDRYIQPDQVPTLERLVRLHQDLHIHPENLDVIVELLNRVEQLQRDVTELQNRLRFYE